MASAVDIPYEAFLLLVDHKDFTTQWGCTIEEANMQDPTARTFLCLWKVETVAAYQNAGWEYFWRIQTTQNQMPTNTKKEPKAPKNLDEQRRDAAEMAYRHHVDNHEDREILDSEGFFAVGKNKLRCHYWVINDTGRQKKESFTAEFEPNSANTKASSGPENAATSEEKV